MSYYGPSVKYYTALDCSCYPEQKVLEKHKDMGRLVEKMDKLGYDRNDWIR